MHVYALRVHICRCARVCVSLSRTTALRLLLCTMYACLPVNKLTEDYRILPKRKKKIDNCRISMILRFFFSRMNDANMIGVPSEETTTKKILETIAVICSNALRFRDSARVPNGFCCCCCSRKIPAISGQTVLTFIFPTKNTNETERQFGFGCIYFCFFFFNIFLFVVGRSVGLHSSVALSLFVHLSLCIASILIAFIVDFLLICKIQCKQLSHRVASNNICVICW